MAPATGPLWAYFHQSDTKPNKVHFRATHWHCIDARRPRDEPIDVDESMDVTLIKNAQCDGEATEKISVVLKSKAAWQRQMAKWQEEFREADEADTDDDKDESEDNLPSTVPVSAAPCARRPRSWLPMTLAKLFGGTIARPIGKPAHRPRVVSEEGSYIELLAAEYSGKEPDAGV
ncbi:hypothetical protein B0H17DRAFT_1134643 [Mycena rosella]|uniref:Uncharacterized protein n=1 Tax=Mycena rosella TaxID=1033263 RepID=A0AAD7DEP9_MYCRO|nr:hypothetical protein B0H17DRAFT_1134643 [Mycena rosella]